MKTRNVKKVWYGRLAMGTMAVVVSVLGSGCGAVSQPPVVVSVRDSLLDRGKVVRITNTSEWHLHQVQVHAAANHEHNLPERTAVVAESLAPHQTVEAGWAELAGRHVVVGDVVSVSCHEYGGRRTTTIPETIARREAAR
jgi:hypothetical protein